MARLFADFLIPSITTLGVLALNIDYILRLNCDLYSEGSSRACILGTLFATPWILSCLLLVPIYIISLQKVSLYNTNLCQIITEGDYARALLVMSYVLYGSLLLIFTLTVKLTYLCYGVHLRGGGDFVLGLWGIGVGLARKELNMFTKYTKERHALTSR